MKETILFSAVVITTSFSLFSFAGKSNKTVSEEILSLVEIVAKAAIHDHAAEVTSLSTNLYASLSLAEKGLSKTALDVALKGYFKLQEEGVLENSDLLTIVDLSQSSRKKRLYLLDVKKMQLLENTFVAHAKNSGVDKAQSFSNVIGSEKTSLGFYVTKGTYTGKHGTSLRLAGLEKGFNDNAEARAIVVHGADYVNAARVQSSYMGRSQGCPAVPMDSYIRIIDQIKNGSALFIYSPNTNYLTKSAVLNS